MLETDHVDLPQFSSTVYRKARVTHVCCECQRTIKKRDDYICVTGRWDDGFAYYKICARCWRLRNKVQSITDYAICFGGLREAIRDEIDNR